MLQKLIEQKSLEKIVRFFGYVPTEELPIYYSQADVFILNSSNVDMKQVEGFGIVLIEAGLMKLPVIGAKDTGMEEAIDDGETGLLVDTRNPIDILAALKKILLHEEYAKELGQKGYERAKKSFTWDKMVRQLNQYIEKYV